LNRQAVGSSNRIESLKEQDKKEIQEFLNIEFQQVRTLTSIEGETEQDYINTLAILINMYFELCF
jgi:hypothetical protein